MRDERAIIKASDYVFTHYNHDGGGGNNKYIAHPKESAFTGKLLIKQDGNISPCCNEFVYGKLLGALGIPAPDCYLMDTDPDDPIFHGYTPVGIEYFDTFLDVDMELLKDNEEFRKEFIEGYSAYAMFSCMGDNIQLGYVPGKHIYTFDYQESFNLENDAFGIISMDDSDRAIEVGKRCLNGFHSYQFPMYVNACASVIADKLSMKPSDVHSMLRNPMKRLLSISSESIGQLTEPLMEFYSPGLAVFYEEYVARLKKVIERYLYQQ